MYTVTLTTTVADPFVAVIDENTVWKATVTKEGRIDSEPLDFQDWLTHAVRHAVMTHLETHGSVTKEDVADIEISLKPYVNLEK